MQCKGIEKVMGGGLGRPLWVGRLSRDLKEEEEPHMRILPSRDWKQQVQRLCGRNILEGEGRELARDLVGHGRVWIWFSS